MTPEDASPATPPVGEWTAGRWDRPIAIVVCILIAFPLVHSAILGLVTKPPVAARLTLPQSALLQAALQLYQQGRYQDAITAGKTLVAENPRSAEAFNNLAVAYAALHMWDGAMTCATTAVRLQPDFQLAKNNLAWIANQWDASIQSAHARK